MANTLGDMIRQLRGDEQRVEQVPPQVVRAMADLDAAIRSGDVGRIDATERVLDLALSGERPVNFNAGVRGPPVKLNRAPSEAFNAMLRQARYRR